MPQLNPSPWLAILLTSWMIFLLFMMTKTMYFKDTNHPTTPMSKKLSTKPWNWPWF
uniref:ATP synthase complex subunit 8 n=1 Tax=Pseudobranchus axanthus TaxID=307979 RepID=C9DHH7_PSEAX|nr:ATP synthase F0 subunit 8 [Pseudobranchus axanthus]